MNKLPEIGNEVTFAKRRGWIVGYATFARHGNVAEKPETYCVVDLDHNSRAYLEPHANNAVTLHNDNTYEHDCFISVMLVHPDNFDTANGSEWS